MITEDYVSFETAKLLKEKGFDGDNRDWYTPDGFIEEVGVDDGIDPTAHEDIFDSLVPAPTLQIVMKWLREMHNLHMLSVPYPHEDGVFYWTYKIAFLDSDTLAVMVTKKARGFDTYEQACEAAIKYCLENLI